MMGSRSRSSVVWLFVLSSLLASCGGGSTGPTPITTPAPANAVRTVLNTQSFTLQPGAATYKNIDYPPEGTVDATIDWAGGNDINLYVTDNVCPGFVDLRAGRCNVITKSDGLAKPERVSFSTSTAAGKIWTFWIYNNGSSAESGNMEVGVTTIGAPPAATPTPAPTGTPNKSNPTLGLAPGPVVRYTIKVRTIDQGGFNYRDPTQDPDGRWIVHPGEFVVFDSTQKNAGGELCEVKNYPPTWTVDDESVIALREGQNNPFLLRTDVKKKGSARIQAKVDGVESNVLEVISTGRP